MSNMKFDDVVVDDLVEFVYNGGSNPGSKRVVKVRSKNKDCFSGHDVYGNPDDNFRNFTLDKVSDLKLVYRPVKPQNKVYFDRQHLVIERKNGDTLRLSLVNNNIDVSYHKNGQNVVLDENLYFGVPSTNDSFIDGLVGVLKKFSS